MSEERPIFRPPRGIFVLSLILLVIFWAALAVIKADATVLPGPVDVARVFVAEAASGRRPRSCAHVLAYALTFVGVMLAFEHFLIQPWEGSSNRWRPATAH
jgi:NitT/TauT family transport system permease protein